MLMCDTLESVIADAIRVPELATLNFCWQMKSEDLDKVIKFLSHKLLDS